MDFKKLMENKPMFYGIIAGVAVIIVLIIIVICVCVFSGSKSNGEVPNAPRSKVIDANFTLATTEKPGVAAEIQALLAQYGIKSRKDADGSRTTVILSKQDNITEDQKDIAILKLVESGLIDGHIGLEIFDKADFKQTKDDKRINLMRAMNGELSRLIRKIPPVKNAQVFVSFPEQSMFQKNQKPASATVQIQLEPGDRLDSMKIKAITNLLIGAVQGLAAENISITDTNGNVYSSIIGGTNDALSKVEENDKYMQQKVATQLDNLVGKGNYVVTVSTFLTQSPVEKTSIIYDPSSKTAITEQGFSEKLGDNTSDNNSAVNAVSVYLPYGVNSTGQNSKQDRKYTRQAHETQYGVTKTQVNEYMKEGIIEKISIAVTLEQSKVPMSMTINDLKVLIAKAASPLVDPENVSIAFKDELNSFGGLAAPDSGTKLPKTEESGNHWWIVGIFLLLGLGFGLNYITTRVKVEAQKHKEELDKLNQKTKEQEKQIRDFNVKTQELIQRQAAMAQNLIEQQNLQKLQSKQQEANAAAQVNKNVNKDEKDENIKEAINELAMDYSGVDDFEAIEKLKSWIEAS